MDLSTFFVAWICAILAMSAFSALLSQVFKIELREQNLLAHLMATLKKSDPKQSPNVLKGWLVHFAFGLFFMIGYEILWYLTGFARTYGWSIIFGTGMGVVGVLGWIGMFRAHPNPPQLHFKFYYFQLVLAHIVFCVMATTVFKVLA